MFLEVVVNLSVNIVQDKVSALIIDTFYKVSLGVVSLAQNLLQILWL